MGKRQVEAPNMRLPRNHLSVELCLLKGRNALHKCNGETSHDNANH